MVGTHTSSGDVYTAPCSVGMCTPDQATAMTDAIGASPAASPDMMEIN